MATCLLSTPQLNTFLYTLIAISAYPTLLLLSPYSPDSPILQPVVSIIMITSYYSSTFQYNCWRRWSLTDEWAISLFSQNYWFDQPMIRLFIRYWVKSIVEGTLPSQSIARENNVRDNNEFCMPFIVGGSCLWSPAKTARRPLNKGIQQLIYKPWPHSSITTKSKVLFDKYLLNILSAAPTFVQQITSASVKIS